LFAKADPPERDFFFLVPAPVGDTEVSYYGQHIPYDKPLGWAEVLFVPDSLTVREFLPQFSKLVSRRDNATYRTSNLLGLYVGLPSTPAHTGRRDFIPTGFWLF
jgi:hypothetical protein